MVGRGAVRRAVAATAGGGGGAALAAAVGRLKQRADAVCGRVGVARLLRHHARRHARVAAMGGCGRGVDMVWTCSGLASSS
eukprot:349694-Chlamydomonas_euryale.AAC.3